MKKTRVKNADRVVVPFDFNPMLPKISNVITKHYRTMITDNPDLKKVFPQPPMASLRQGPNLRKMLCKSTLPKVSRNPTRGTHRTTNGWRRCSTVTSRQCPICPLTPTSATTVTSHLTGYTHKINSSLNCKSENVLYVWRCTKCGHNFDINKTANTHTDTNHKQGTIYIGMTKRKFSTRMSEHRDYAKFHKTDEPSGEHFCQPGHSFHHIQGLAVEKVMNKDPFVLKAREAWLIKKFDCHRNGLNKEP